MRTSRLLRLLYPQNLVLFTVMISVAVWSLPMVNGLRRGFTDRAPVTIVGVSVLSCWYGAIYVLTFLGFKIGRKFKPSRYFQSTIGIDRVVTYRILVLIGVVGMAATYYRIIQILGVSGMLFSLSRNTANDLKNALYSDYSVGLLSLRYVSAICGGIGLWRLLSGKRTLLDAVALLSWLGTAMLSSRLSIIWGMLTALTMWLVTIPGLSKKLISRLLVAGLLGALLLWILNYSRNANYYRQKGTEDFGLSGLGEIVTYVGSPVQVSLGVANKIEAALDGQASNELVEWDQSLSTDSAFERVISIMGYWAFPYMFTTVFAYSVIAGLCFEMRGTWLFLGFPIIDYAFAEIWRVDLFSQGIFYTNLLIGMSVPLFTSLISRQIHKPDSQSLPPRRTSTGEQKHQQPYAFRRDPPARQKTS